MTYKRCVVVLASILMMAGVLTTGCAKNDKNVVRMSKSEKAKRDKELKEAKKLAEQKAAEVDEARAQAEAAQLALDEIQAGLDEANAEIEQRKEQIKAAETALEARVAAANKEVAAAEAARDAAQDAVEAAEENLLQAKEAVRVAELEKSRANEEAITTRRAADALYEDAANKFALAEASVQNAAKVAEKAEKKFTEAQEREQQVNKLVDMTKSMFADMKLDPVFDQVMDRKDESLIFQVSVIGKAEVRLLHKIRKQINELNSEKKFSNAKSLAPSVNATAKKILDLNDGKKIGDFVSVNDRFVVKANVLELKELRDEVNAISTDQQSLIMIVRLVENVRVGISMKIKGREALENGSEDLENIFEIATVDLGASEATNILDIENLDLTSPGKYVFGAHKQGVCNKVSVTCISELNKLGLLNAEVGLSEINITATDMLDAARLGIADKKVTVKQFLANQLTDSIEQLGRDRSYLEGVVTDYNEGVIDKISSFFGSNTKTESRVIPKMVDGKMVMVTEETEIEVGKKPTKKIVVEELELRYTISMVETVTQNGLVYADSLLAAGTGLNGIKMRISPEDLANKEIEIQLPISSLEVSKTNFREQARKSSDLIQQIKFNLDKQPEVQEKILNAVIAK